MSKQVTLRSIPQVTLPVFAYRHDNYDYFDLLDSMHFQLVLGDQERRFARFKQLNPANRQPYGSPGYYKLLEQLSTHARDKLSPQEYFNDYQTPVQELEQRMRLLVSYKKISSFLLGTQFGGELAEVFDRVEDPLVLDRAELHMIHFNRINVASDWERWFEYDADSSTSYKEIQYELKDLLVELKKKADSANITLPYQTVQDQLADGEAVYYAAWMHDLLIRHNLYTYKRQQKISTPKAPKGGWKQFWQQFKAEGHRILIVQILYQLDDFKTKVFFAYSTQTQSILHYIIAPERARVRSYIKQLLTDLEVPNFSFCDFFSRSGEVALEDLQYLDQHGIEFVVKIDHKIPTDPAYERWDARLHVDYRRSKHWYDKDEQLITLQPWLNPHRAHFLSSPELMDKLDLPISEIWQSLDQQAALAKQKDVQECKEPQPAQAQQAKEEQAKEVQATAEQTDKHQQAAEQAALAAADSPRPFLIFGVYGYPRGFEGYKSIREYVFPYITDFDFDDVWALATLQTKLGAMIQDGVVYLRQDLHDGFGDHYFVTNLGRTGKFCTRPDVQAVEPACQYLTKRIFENYPQALAQLERIDPLLWHQVASPYIHSGLTDTDQIFFSEWLHYKIIDIGLDGKNQYNKLKRYYARRIKSRRKTWGESEREALWNCVFEDVSWEESKIYYAKQQEYYEKYFPSSKLPPR